MRRILATWFLLTTALLCFDVAAHDLPNERKLIVDVGAESVEMMLVYQQPETKAVGLLLRKYDLDGDGELTDGEAKMAGREWMPRMLHGLQFEVAGERPQARKPEIKFRREDDGALTAAAYMKWSLDSLEPGDKRTFHVRVLDTDNATKTLVEIRAGDDLDAETTVNRMVEPGEEATLTVVGGR